MKQISILILTAILLVACGGSDEPENSGPGVQSLNVELNDIYYGDANDNITNPETWTVRTGGAINVNATNDGALEHNWAVLKADATLPETIGDPASVEDLILFDIGNVVSGESKTERFNAPAPGEYTIICTVAGHYPAMQGKLIIEP